MPAAVVIHIVPEHEFTANSFDYRADRLVLFFNEKVNVVAHKTVRIQFKLADLLAILQRKNKLLVILLAGKYLLLVYAAQHNVVYSAFAFLSCGS